MYLTHNEGKPVVAKRFVRTLNNKIKKHMTSISKNVYIDNLSNIFDKYNNTYHSTIKMKPTDVKPNTYIDFSKNVNDKNPKFKLVILLEYQNIKTFFQKTMFQIGLKTFL